MGLEADRSIGVTPDRVRTLSRMRIISIGVLLFSMACGGAQTPDSPTPASAETPEAGEAGEAAPASAAEAASQGATLYGAHCAGCHGDAGQGVKGPPVVGKDALPLDPRPDSKREGQFKTALDVFHYVKTNMPGNAPGSLKDDEYRAIIAFDLKANGVDLTGKDLSDDTLAAIALH